MISTTRFKWFLLTFISGVFSFSALLFAAKPIPLIAGGNNHVCVADGLTDNTVWCKGLKTPSPTEAVPADIVNIRALSSGAWHACAVYLDATSKLNKIKCWGDNRFSQLTHPVALEGEMPVDVVSGPFSNCVMFKNLNRKTNRVACGGAPTSKSKDVPSALNNPSYIGSFEDDICAATDTADGSLQIECWGAHGQARTLLTGVKISPRQMPYCSWNSGNDISCYEQSRYKNFKSKADLTQNKFSAQVSQSLRGITCALTELQIVCQGGGLSSPLAFNLQEATLAYDLVLTAHHVCVLHNEGLSCYNIANGSQQKIDLTKQSVGDTFVLKRPSDIRRVLQDLSSRVYSFDAKLLTTLQSIVQPLSEHETLAVIKVIGPYLTGLDYNSISDEETRQLTQSMSQIHIDLPQEESGKFTTSVKLRVLIATLSTAKPVLLRTQSADSELIQVLEAEQLVALISQSIATKIGLNAAERARIQKFADIISTNPYVGNRSSILHAIVSELE